ncbi:molybdopterin-guanine dinucleotide biosynthesis protein A [Paramixta manurensis]|uniref:Molybdenum cofactor guanylyltransferase n=1 Tax=Paramixta manurensis TaxID=2740817 RepID=A0A6M8UGU0_9GAMM|nr:molybdopterin-guanine dinucleotide biosynthesis protein A [Erwiniaceae bacterium PD-1]
MRQQCNQVTGVILAGGRSQRMGGEDKGLMMFRTQPLWQHVLQRLQPQVAQVVISANRHPQRYRQSGLTVIGDTLPDFPGPLAGMLATLRAIDTEWAAFSSCDTPFIPHDFVQRLWQEKHDAQAVWVRSAARDHPALALVHRDVADRLEDFLHRGERRLRLFLQQVGGRPVLFDDDERLFININTPQDLLLYQEEK